MRVQHVWAKTGTSPVAFHNTTGDVALCPGQEPCPGGSPIKTKSLNALISNGPGRLWRRRIPLTRWPTYSLTALLSALPGRALLSAPPLTPTCRPCRYAIEPKRLMSATPSTRDASCRLSHRHRGAVDGVADRSRILSVASVTGHPRCYPPDRGSHVARWGCFGTLETFVARRGVAPCPGGQRAWVGLGGSHDRVPLGAAFSGRRRHRVPLGAVCDTKGTQ
jgi:hypothetical protein